MTDSIKCIVGLGNPGAEYEQTCHNAGFWFVDELARQQSVAMRVESKFFGELARIDINGKDCWLLKPGTFMNRSGQSVSALAKFYKLPASAFLVVHDELDLPAGDIKFKKGGGHGGHNGLRDIMSALSDKNFYRYRIGVGHPGHKDAVVDHVLSRPSRDDQQAIETAIDEGIRQVELLLGGEYQKVMNTLHTKK